MKIYNVYHNPKKRELQGRADKKMKNKKPPAARQVNCSLSS